MSRAWERILAEGLIAGFLGYAIVVAFCAVADLAQGRSPFYTAAVLGSVVFFGLRDPGALVIWPGPILAYNGVHMVAFLLLGTFMAWLTSLAERGNDLWYVSILIFLIAVPHVAGLPIWFTAPARQALSLWVVVGATLLAATGMAVYLWHAHPRLRATLRENGAEIP
jgi:hypothetical protein